jgi:hypothetical protein
VSRYDRSKIKQFAQELAEHAKTLSPPLVQAPRPRIIVPDDFAPELPCSSEHVWLCEQIRWLTRIYGLEAFVRQECRGYASLDSMPDDELREVYQRVGRAIECIKDGVSFEDADLIEFDSTI